MLTGDALAVATEIAQGVGLPNIRRVADLKAAVPQAPVVYPTTGRPKIAAAAWT